jgi:hypothetical protein
LRRIIPVTLVCVLAFATAALAYSPATITDVTQDSVTVSDLDCGTQYRLQIEERNASNTAWNAPTTQTVTTAPCPASAPVANFSVSPDPAVRNRATTFTSTGTCAATPCTFEWFHGDASSTDAIGTGADASFTYIGPAGPRTVTLKVTDNQDREAVRTLSFQLTDAAATPTPTPTATPTPSLTATPSPTPTATPPATSGFPDASNTGVPPGTTLTPYTGPSTISTAGTVIEGKTMGCIRVTASNVVIRKSKISCAGGYAVMNGDRAYTGAPLLIEDTEIDCKNGPGTALGEANLTVRRVDISGCENGGDINQNWLVEDSYIHDLYNGGSSHTDGLQMASGHIENGQVVPGSLNVTIRHNTIYGMGADGSFGTSAIISNRGADRNILIERNLMGGGAVAIYCEQGARGTNYRVLNNAFTRRFGPKVGYYGVSTDCRDEDQSGNYYYETGEPLTLG